MPIIRATAVLQMDSAETKDEARNVWHFRTGAFPPDDFITKIGEALEAFYDGIAWALSPLVNTGTTVGRGTLVEMATVNFGAAGSADDVVSELFATRTMNLETLSNTNPSLPQELACCLSFRGDTDGVPEELGVTRPKSRRRGRVFIGPLNTSVLSAPGAGRPVVHQTLRDNMLSSYASLVARLGAAGSPNAQHVVYSPTSGEVFPVTVVHVDDAWDIIRGRGTAAGGRSSQVVNQPSI